MDLSVLMTHDARFKGKWVTVSCPVPQAGVITQTGYKRATEMQELTAANPNPLKNEEDGSPMIQTKD